MLEHGDVPESRGSGGKEWSIRILAISDALGETAETVAKAAASQFNSGRAEIRRFSHMKSREDLEQVLQTARESPGTVIVYTLVLPELRSFLRERALLLGIPQVDVLGPVLDMFASVLPGQPKLKPGLVHMVDEAYFRRVEAVEFAVRADDGKNPRDLPRADVILLGISRTSKTPVSMYLANRGYKVANVPLVPEVALPREMFQVEPGKIIGLIVDPLKLKSIRLERLKGIGLDGAPGYASLERVQRELVYAKEVFLRLGCRVIDVTNQAVEETANRVIGILEEKS